jgi:peptidoglycan/LPS O-acetylase OafA/YrhL
VGSRRASERSPRLTGLDGLRGLAAMAVAVLHVAFYTNRPRPLESLGDAFMQGLRLGVPLFFVLSGMLLYLPWVRATRSTRPAPDVKVYALRRAARILPAYYFALIGATIILVPSGSPRAPSASQAAAIAALVQNWWPDAAQKLNPPAWTLAVEATFYLLLPLLGLATLRWLRTPRRQLAGCAALVAASIGANALFVVLGRHGWHRTLPGSVYAFALGMALAVILPRARGLIRPARIALIMAGAALIVGDALAHEPARLPGIDIWQDLPAAAGFAAIVLAVAATDRSPVLDSTPLAWIGERSYALYLWHYPVILLFAERHLLPRSTVAASVLVIGVSLGAAAFSWRFVERPILERARALSDPGRRQRARRRRTAGRPRRVHASSQPHAALARHES